MVSRDTAVHAGVVVFVVAAVVALQWVFPSDDPVLVVLLIALYGLVYAGGHLVLAVRGEDGMVPVASRWRFVALVSLLCGLGSLAYLTDPVAVGPVTTDALLGATGVVTVLVYAVVEARDGYRSSAPG